jgi:parallel beta-helix repeat protein
MSEAMNNRKKLVIAIVVVTILVISIIIIRFPLTVGSIVVPDDYSSIQTAIDHVLVGQTIYVRSGVYTEQSITINKPVSLVGENPTNTILVGINNNKYSPPYVIQVSADSVRISGFTIINGSLGGIRIETIGSDKQPSGCTITGNIISNNNIGISTYDGQDLTISYNQIFNNTEGRFCFFFTQPNNWE